MAETKAKRDKKRQLGQFMTPLHQARNLLRDLNIDRTSTILEPSFGEGSFIIAVIENLLGDQPTQQSFNHIMEHCVYGVEIDPLLYRATVEKIERRWWPLPKKHNLVLGDYFTTSFPFVEFDLIIGNPPFGGTFDPHIEDSLDRTYGKWRGHKLKKETYSFFIARCLEQITYGGTLRFIVSDTFLTIGTMAGLRHRLADQAFVCIDRLEYFSEETDQPMVVLTAVREDGATELSIEGTVFQRRSLEGVGKFSWGASPDLIQYFNGDTLGNYIQCTSGMTVGNNALFIREISEGKIIEDSDFIFFDDPITLERERERARLGKLSPKKQAEILDLEARGATRRNVRVVPKRKPEIIALPHPDYKYYNKAVGEHLYAHPTHAIFWKDQGDAVLTFKKNGNWYLHGVGGAKFFEKEGITWQLIGNQIRMRYLPPGYILDSGAPCGFLREGVDQQELWFILAWTNTSLATTIMKGAINHTRNIQSKDLERLPYPWWVDSRNKKQSCDLVRSWVDCLEKHQPIPTDWRRQLDTIFAF